MEQKVPCHSEKYKWDKITKCEVILILEKKGCLIKQKKTNHTLYIYLYIAPIILLIEAIKFHLTGCMQNDVRTRRMNIFFFYRTMCNNLSRWINKSLILYIFVSAFLEVLALNDQQGLFPPLGAERTDWAPPACPGRVKGACVFLLWCELSRIQTHWPPLADAPPHLGGVVRKISSEGRTQFDGTSEWHCGGISKKKKPIQSRHGYLTGIQFFMCVYFLPCDVAFAPWVLIKPARCLSSVYNRNKMRISSRDWFLLIFSGFWGLTMGAFPSSVQIGKCASLNVNS